MRIWQELVRNVPFSGQRRSSAGIGQHGLGIRCAALTDVLASITPWLEALRSPGGALLFIPLYGLWVTLLLPGVWASMLAGALYGTWWGSVVVFVGACLGAEVVFLLGRHWLRTWARQRLERFPKLMAVERGVTREGLKLVLLTRLSPAFPFSLLNLAYGLSDVSLRDYTIGLIGILPGTVLFCALGALAGDVARFVDVLAARRHPAHGPAGWALWPLWRWCGSSVGPPAKPEGAPPSD